MNTLFGNVSEAQNDYTSSAIRLQASAFPYPVGAQKTDDIEPFLLSGNAKSSDELSFWQKIHFGTIDKKPPECVHIPTVLLLILPLFFIDETAS